MPWTPDPRPICISCRKPMRIDRRAELCVACERAADAPRALDLGEVVDGGELDESLLYGEWRESRT